MLERNDLHDTVISPQTGHMTAPQPSISFALSSQCNRAPPPSESTLAHTYAIPPTHSLSPSPPPTGPSCSGSCSFVSPKTKTHRWKDVCLGRKRGGTDSSCIWSTGMRKGSNVYRDAVDTPPIFTFWAARITFSTDLCCSSFSFVSPHVTADGNLKTCVIHKED